MTPLRRSRAFRDLKQNVSWAPVPNSPFICSSSSDGETDEDEGLKLVIEPRKGDHITTSGIRTPASRQRKAGLDSSSYYTAPSSPIFERPSVSSSNNRKRAEAEAAESALRTGPPRSTLNNVGKGKEEVSDVLNAIMPQLQEVAWALKEDKVLHVRDALNDVLTSPKFMNDLAEAVSEKILERIGRGVQATNLFDMPPRSTSKPKVQQYSSSNDRAGFTANDSLLSKVGGNQPMHPLQETCSQDQGDLLTNPSHIMRRFSGHISFKGTATLDSSPSGEGSATGITEVLQRAGGHGTRSSTSVTPSSESNYGQIPISADVGTIMNLDPLITNKSRAGGRTSASQGGPSETASTDNPTTRVYAEHVSPASVRRCDFEEATHKAPNKICRGTREFGKRCRRRAVTRRKGAYLFEPPSRCMYHALQDRDYDGVEA